MSLNRKHTQEEKEAVRSKLLGHPVLPQTREKIRRTLQGHTLSDETRLKISKTLRSNRNNWTAKLKCAWADPDRRAKRLAIMSSQEYKDKIGYASREKWNDPDFRKRMSGENASMWNGGKSFEPYCVKFNDEFKNRVRAYFNYTCFECGTLETTVRLSVHHVTGNKQTCCDDSEIAFIPLCRSCHAKISFDKKGIYDDYTRWVLWIINIYFGGKCFFTKDEMAIIKSADYDQEH